MSTIPSSLQSVFWSVNIHDLDINRDKTYIIHQVLAYGNLDALKWLFHLYALSTIKEVFITHPMRTYRPASFYFTKEILLDIKEKVPEELYVATPIRYS